MNKIKSLYADLLVFPADAKRVRWIDYAKGIAIILVLVAHALSGANWFNIWAYSFHLPVFFILSGLLLSYRKMAQPFGKLLKKYLKSLILPYYLIAFAVLLVELAKDLIQKDFSRQNALSLLSEWAFMIGIKADWFLPCLFFAILINLLVFKLFRGNKILYPAAILCVAVAAYFIPKESRLLNVLLHGCVAALFVCVGVMLSELKSNFKKVLRFIKKYKVLFTFVLLALNVLLTVLNGKVSLSEFNFGKNYVLYLINGVVGSLFLLLLCKCIEKPKLRLINYCGKNSLVIMAVHMEIMALVGAVLAFLLPETSALFICLNIIISFVVSVLCIPFVNFVLKKIK
ncbi:MAG TPA: acyltransferase family protein [Candidatus Eubacterium faecale]|jgi:acyltransferase|uniref:Acyltransferase family protein n=1 Tax=Candidatus Eubacterium faecale TaxID=2838568 RepID=A0A9D2MHN4_9FIRM|nr:acyltransferase family protein [Candidatus Eubacterium faecale]